MICIFQDDARSPSSPDVGFENLKMSFASQKVEPKSKHLILFCHGGGFVSLTSKSFEVFRIFLLQYSGLFYKSFFFSYLC